MCVRHPCHVERVRCRGITACHWFEGVEAFHGRVGYNFKGVATPRCVFWVGDGGWSQFRLCVRVHCEGRRSQVIMQARMGGSDAAGMPGVGCPGGFALPQEIRDWSMQEKKGGTLAWYLL